MKPPVLLIRYVLILIISFVPLTVLAEEVVSYDLDETLISSANMTKGDLKIARQLGYKIQKSKLEGYQYIVRPGAEELLNYTKDLGFRVIVITANYETYARDIINSSGLNKYIDAIYTAEDLSRDYNTDYETYPYHRNRTYKPAKTFVKKVSRATKRYTIGLGDAVVKRSFLYLTGSTNFRPYLPSANTAKYPPIYGSRFHVDDTLRNIDKPLDFVGIKVEPFDGTHVTPRGSDMKILWIEDIKEKLDYLKKYGWVDLYRKQYHNDPVVTEVVRMSYEVCPQSLMVTTT